MCRIKAFPFWKKQYLFHPDATTDDRLLKLYHPYNKIAKVNWWLWKKLNFYQNLFTFEIQKATGLYKFINNFIETNPDYLWAINRGTQSKYRKNTGLFVSKQKSDQLHKNFFFKWGNSVYGINSIQSEAMILNQLKDYTFTPRLFDFNVDKNEAYYTTEIIHGRKYSNLDINNEILALITQIHNLNPTEANNYCSSNNLETSFNHGDFGPWNLIIEEKTGTIKAIDWEFCGIYPMGFDFLYYIFSVDFLIRKKSMIVTSKDKYNIIDNHYKALGIQQWKPYLKEFAGICSNRNANTKIGNEFLKLFNYCNQR